MPKQITPEFEFLVGSQLPEIFEKHFKRASCNRDGSPSDAYLAFAAATLKEYRIAGSRKDIKLAAREIPRWKALRARFLVIDRQAFFKD